MIEHARRHTRRIGHAEAYTQHGIDHDPEALPHPDPVQVMHPAVGIPEKPDGFPACYNRDTGFIRTVRADAKKTDRTVCLLRGPRPHDRQGASRARIKGGGKKEQNAVSARRHVKAVMTPPRCTALHKPWGRIARCNRQYVHDFPSPMAASCQHHIFFCPATC